MTGRSHDRWFALCGIAFVVLELGGTFLSMASGKTHGLTVGSSTADIARAIAHLREQNVELMRVSTDHPSWKEAFIHPRHAHGVLIQIAQSRFSDEEAAAHHLTDHETADHRHLRLADLTG